MTTQKLVHECSEQIVMVPNQKQSKCPLACEWITNGGVSLQWNTIQQYQDPLNSMNLKISMVNERT